MTFSVIVPVYNVEKYLAKCLESILNQTYTDFEIIVVNDGSPDNSQQIIDEYAKKYPEKIKPFVKENGGLSDARNFGIEKADGDYLLFVDSDDYIDINTLDYLKKEIDSQTADVIGFNLVTVDESGHQTEVVSKPAFRGLSGQEAIISLVNSKKYFEPACGFAFRTEYWKEQNFSFIKGIYHEDFALIPLTVLLAEKVTCLDLNLYYYVSTDNSITRTQGFERTKKKAYDLLVGYDFLVEQCEKRGFQNTLAGRMYLAYAANCAVYRLETLEDELKEEFRKELKKRNVVKYIAQDTFKRKIRKLFIRIKNRI